MDVVERLEQNGIRVDLSLVADIARRFGVAELSVFGSAIREDIRADSDVDVLVTFDPTANISLFDLMDLEVELTEAFGRSVDLVEAKSLTNPIRREAILASREPLYAA